jgi:TPR repeat protein
MSRRWKTRRAAVRSGKIRTPTEDGSYVVALEKRIARSDPEAMWLLGQGFEEGLVDSRGKLLLPRNHRRAVELYRRGARLGHSNSMQSLAAHLLAGSGVQKRPTAALRWYVQAAEQGDMVGAENAGVVCKLLGRHRAAASWFGRAAALGNASASLELAKARLYGVGVARDVDIAMRLLKQVSNAEATTELEREEARLLLAFIHLDGWLVRRSHTEAVRWLKQAATRGSSIAREVLRELATMSR